MTTASFSERRHRLEAYFDRTAHDAWAKLTSDAPVGRIRATVRAGRNEMRDTLVSWLPADMRGMRLLDAGCGSGALALEAAARGADVVAIDISPNLIQLAKDRSASLPHAARVDFRSGDMLDPALGHFDYVVAMDSLIHYKARDVLAAISHLGERTSSAIIMTFAPRTPLLTMMWVAGRAFPRSDRAPAIEPLAPRQLVHAVAREPRLNEWAVVRSKRVSKGFYISQGIEIARA